MRKKLKKGLEEYPVYKKVIVSNYWSIVLDVFLFSLIAFSIICIFFNLFSIILGCSFSFILKSFLLWSPPIIVSYVIIAQYTATKYEEKHEKEEKIGYVKKISDENE